jgi:hypothetical protein
MFYLQEKRVEILSPLHVSPVFTYHVHKTVSLLWSIWQFASSNYNIEVNQCDKSGWKFMHGFLSPRLMKLIRTFMKSKINVFTEFKVCQMNILFMY